MKPLAALRSYQSPPFWADHFRMQWWIWARQKGKSTTAAKKALRRMMTIPGLDCIFCSASVNLGVEFVRKEASVWQSVMRDAKKKAEDGGLLFDCEALDLDLDAVCDLFEHQKLQTKIWHDRTTFSRSLVVAPNPDTAVGWTGDIYLDEVGRMPEFRDVLEAILPFMTSNPQFQLTGVTTPPPNDSHYSYELTVPHQEDFPVNPEGNWYRSRAGYMVHRVDAWDAFAAGVWMYDDNTGEKVTPDQHRAKAFDKNAWDRNHALRFLKGGTAAISLSALHLAQARGRTEGLATNITEQLILQP